MAEETISSGPTVRSRSRTITHAAQFADVRPHVVDKKGHTRPTNGHTLQYSLTNDVLEFLGQGRSKGTSIEKRRSRGRGTIPASITGWRACGGTIRGGAAPLSTRSRHADGALAGENGDQRSAGEGL